MNAIIQKIFKNKAIAIDRLIDYGFALDGEMYIYRADILDGQMQIVVNADGQGNIDTQVIDLDSQEVYTLFLVEDAVGSFVGGVRSAYENVLSDIADKCCERQVFKTEQAKKLIKYIREKYGDELEFLWEKFDDNAIWRRKDNRKWYALIVKLSARKLGCDSDEVVEIINIRVDPQETQSLIDGKRYYPAYHMNKKSWITICLDGSLAFDEICERVDASYALALKKK